MTEEQKRLVHSGKSKNQASNKILGGVKYAYIAVFFAMLAGVFNPLITGQSFDRVIIGVVVLFVGLAGAILLYKAAISEKRRMIYLGSGFVLIITSIIFIYALIGRLRW